jgi:hypothetical protein
MRRTSSSWPESSKKPAKLSNGLGLTEPRLLREGALSVNHTDRIFVH